jgi:hypothetical protein
LEAIATARQVLSDNRPGYSCFVLKSNGKSAAKFVDLTDAPCVAG